MTRLLYTLLLGGASGACALAALGLALYAGHPDPWAPASLFAAIGFAAGLVCNCLHLVFGGLPVQPPPAMSQQALAGMVRATLASASAERQPRSGTAADRRPTPAELASTVLAEAAAKPAPLPAPQPGAAPAPAEARPPSAEAPRFASSSFGG